MSLDLEFSKRRPRVGACVAGLAMLALLTAPATAPAGNKAGGGAVAGVMQYGSPGIPQPLAPPPAKCNMPVTFTVSAGAVVVDTQIVGYAGPAKISNHPLDLIDGGLAQGTNRTNCESFLLGSGLLSVDLQGKNQVNGSEIQCDNLNGHWIRVFDAIEIALNGPCQIGDAYTTSTIAFVGGMTHTPDPMDVGGGITHPYTTANVNGAFVITPG
jgi:hypothetical protein